MKICNKCEKPKPLSEYGFYAGKQNMQCIRCCAMAKAAAKKLREKKLQKPREVEYWPWQYNGVIYEGTSV